MKKIVRKVGDSAGLIFNKEERQVHNIKVGEVVDVELKAVIKKIKEVTQWF